MKIYELTQAAYGQRAGSTIALPEDDPTVQMNVEAGVLTEPSHSVEGEAAKMTCPICEENMKRPPKLETPDELAAHYADKHAGFVVPDWRAD